MNNPARIIQMAVVDGNDDALLIKSVLLKLHARQ